MVLEMSWDDSGKSGGLSWERRQRVDSLILAGTVSEVREVGKGDRVTGVYIWSL